MTIMVSPEEASRLKTIYIVVLIFTTFKGVGVLVPDLANNLNSTINHARFDGCSSSNVTDGEKVGEWRKLGHQWIDSMTLLQTIALEMLPLELICIKRAPIKFKDICIWTSLHVFLSSFYFINRMVMVKKVKDMMCMIDLALQVISLSLVLAIFLWSRVMIKKRIERIKLEALNMARELLYQDGLELNNALSFV